MANKKGFASGGSAIQVNTAKVRSAVNTLTNLNNDMDKSFESVNKTMSSLNASWDGTASSAAMSKFNSLKNAFMGSSGRKAVMHQYISFLSKAVADDYDTTEAANTSLSNLFK